MPLPIIANTFRVAFNWTSATTGQHAINVMHFRTSVLNAGTLLTLIDASVAATMWNATTGLWAVTRLDCTPLDGSSSTQQAATTGAKWTGNGGALDFVPALAQVVSLRTGLRGRSNRGRVYLPAVTEALQTAGTLNFSLATQQTAWNTFATAMSVGTAPLVIASYLHATAANVTSQTPEAVCATQRRRQSRLR